MESIEEFKGEVSKFSLPISHYKGKEHWKWHPASFEDFYQFLTNRVDTFYFSFLFCPTVYFVNPLTGFWIQV